MKLSNILAVFVVIETVYTLGLAQEWFTSLLFTVQHEDYVLTANLMTWFIVRSIEKIHIFNTDSVNIENVEMGK